MPMTDKPKLTLGGVEAEEPAIKRLSMMIWGRAGTGKTTLACTAPGRKALINFDPDGASSIVGMKNVTVFDLAHKVTQLGPNFKDADPLQLEKVIENFDTIIVDSVSSIAESTLARGISITKGATIERPSPGAYQARNNLAIEFVRNMLALTAKYDKNFICIAHEGAPNKNDDGSVIEYTLSLGGQLPQQLAMRMNEIWYLYETEKTPPQKKLLVRQARLRTPVKSRMFDASKFPEFVWSFDINNTASESNMTIDRWFTEWLNMNSENTEEHSLRKIPVPT
jgi:hypothetical protein